MTMNKTFLAATLLICSFLQALAQPMVDRVEPPNWWVGMKNSHLQLLIHGKELAHLKPVIKNQGVVIDSMGKLQNPNYLLLYLSVGKTAKAGTFEVVLYEGSKKVLSVPYQLKPRREGSAERKGFSQKDLIYLVMPDRFANGDTSNDSHPLLIEKANRENPDGRHGGDLAGIEKHLDYFADLGMTALWINPFVENNMAAYSYHGYAITDFYKTDARLGTNEGFAGLVKKAHKMDLKIIMDMVFNHWGMNHWLMKDLPAPDWIHQFDSYTRSSFKAPVVMDPYASAADKQIMLNGWFDSMMPDLNQKNPHLALYLIQNSIWWVEYADLDGIRMDTYMYPDPDFMAVWRKQLLKEYPSFNVVGEVWIENKSLHAYWVKDAPNTDGYNSELEYITDFPLFADIRQGLNEKTGWETGAERIYYNLAQDFVYKHPENNLTFLTNHDVSQFYTLVGENFGKFKLGVTLLLTLRGIPQFYQGMEILMTGDQGHGHGRMRKDFPGGWAGDASNAFLAEGRTPLQNEAFNFVKSLAQWRKSSAAVQTGKLMQFVPENDVYVYFRYNNQEKVMVVLNFADEERIVTTSRFEEMLKGCRSGMDVVASRKIENLAQITIAPLSAMVITLQK